ncbi:site-specific integrase [uncultured Limosilactobacillus sp.]|uniref:tyrosine-type recombinase/integrase n=1 Tax=uncultured Limosilactobacillus sp. TaxID=2837629 RepID=UPI0025FC2363|nr:site-specific integrase [uncultured Limosilactobacillus sp.]
MAIKKLKTGKWQAIISWYDSSGKRHFKRKSFRLKQQAESYLISKEVDKQKGNLSVRSDQPFPEYFWNWFETYKEANVTERTKATYHNALGPLRTYFANTPISKIDRRLYREFIAAFGKNHARATVRKYNSLYHACIKDAIYDGDISKDFIRNTDLVYDKSRTKEVEYINVKQFHQLANYCFNHLNPRYTSKYMILTALYTGCRLGEIQGLQWQNVNFNFKTITIDHAWDAINHEFKDTKNESSKRIIRVNNDLLSTLKQLLKRTSRPIDQVFKNGDGEIPTSNAVNKTLRNTMNELGIVKKGFHFHSLRHSHVAYLLDQHVDLYIISKRLGHADIATTSRVYSYLIDEYKVRSDDQIEGILDGVKDQPITHATGIKKT